MMVLVRPCQVCPPLPRTMNAFESIDALNERPQSLTECWGGVHLPGIDILEVSGVTLSKFVNCLASKLYGGSNDEHHSSMLLRRC